MRHHRRWPATDAHPAPTEMPTWLFVLGSRIQTVADGEERGGPEAHEDAKTLSMGFVLTLLVVPYGNTGSDGCEAGRIGHSRSEAESTKTFDHAPNRNLGVDITWSSSVVVSGRLVADVGDQPS